MRGLNFKRGSFVENLKKNQKVQEIAIFKKSRQVFFYFFFESHGLAVIFQTGPNRPESRK